MRGYLWISGLVFGAVALLHVLRLAYAWPAQIGSWAVPLELSWVGAVAAGVLCAWGLRLAGRRTGP